MSKNILRSLLITTIIVFVYCYFFANQSNFVKTRLMSRDIVSRLIYKFSKTPKEAREIAVVSIDRESLKNLDIEWPWGRRIFADFILRLKEYNPRVIYLDFSFIGESDEKEQDDLFAQALSEAGNVLIPFYFDEKGRPLFPLQRFIEASSGFGPVNKLRDIDLSIRDTPLIYFSPDGRVIDYSIELITICKFLGISLGDISLDKGNLVIDIRGTKEEIPITKDGILHINYLATLDDINVIPFWKVLKERLEPQIFKDKLVIVGLTDKAFIDTYKTPLGISSGVEIIVNTILTVLSHRFVGYVPRDIDLPIILLIALLITITAFKLPPWKGLFVTILELSGYLILSIVFAWYGYRIEFFSVCFVGAIVYLVTKIYRFIYLLEEQNLNLQKALKDLKEAEAELIESEKLAAMGRLTAQLSHEINNPLCAILNSINTIKYIATHSGELVKINEISDRISGELQRLTKLTRDILTFTRPTKEEEKPIDINMVLTETTNFYRDQLEGRKIEILLNLDNTLPQVTVSGNKMKQIFSNIILNAQEVMSGGGKLSVSTQRLNKHFIEISLADTGSGIPHEIMDRIFEPFFTTKAEGIGTGLGLYTVRNIVKGYGGTIKVNSTVGKGTEFRIKLPVR